MNDLWAELRSAMIGVVKAAVKYDKKGIDLAWLNDEDNAIEGCTSVAAVQQAFDTVLPSGSTPTSMRLDDILRPYIEDCEYAKQKRSKLPKPMILVVVSDGRADDSEGLRDTIVEMATRLDEARLPSFQLGITFIQIGDDPDATAFLAELDDDLEDAHQCRDIVDCRQYEGSIDATFVLKSLLGSVNKAIDNDN